VSAVALLSCKPETETAVPPAPVSGHEIYMTRCIACHQADGGGLPAICPPLNNSPRLAGPPADVIRILLLGMKGGIVRNGNAYNGIMPSWRFDLTDGEIAGVVNEVYSRWKPGSAPVTGEMVRQIREETAPQKLFPTAKELGFSD